jgi:ABC-type multidrug transport system fused ATPase/permease subunit
MPQEMMKGSGGSDAMMSPARLLRILLSYAQPYAARVVLLLLTLLVESAFITLLALSLKFLIDFAITPRDARALALILSGLVIGFTLTAASQVLRDYLYAWLGARILNDLRQEMFRH